MRRIVNSSVQLRQWSALLAAVVLLSAAGASSRAEAQLTRQLPTSLNDSEFWEIFTSSSEAGGSFTSENLVSNEMTFQHVIPTLQRTVAPGGAYIGVGPEQNFTYVANLRPAIAVIVDIRRQGVLQHLLYKSVFELSPTRAQFVSRLFSRPLPAMAADVSPAALFGAASAAPRSDAALEATWLEVVATLRDRHHFPITDGDLAVMRRLLEAFATHGPSITYGHRTTGGPPMLSNYASFGALQSATNADSVNMAFLANEELYGRVRTMQQRNLVIPVVGDFAGPRALRSVGEFLRRQNVTVSAFYVSNVEQYLHASAEAARLFYDNVASLPLDASASFIRSVPRGGAGNAGTLTLSSRFAAFSAIAGTSVGVFTVDSIGPRRQILIDTTGARGMHLFVDSIAGLRTNMLRDTSGTVLVDTLPGGVVVYRGNLTRPLVLLDSMRAVLPTLVRDTTFSIVWGPRPALTTVRTAGGGLVSGIASIRETLEAVRAGNVRTYADVVAMTRVGASK
jgi:hypothetical protein